MGIISIQWVKADALNSKIDAQGAGGRPSDIGYTIVHELNGPEVRTSFTRRKRYDWKA